MADSPIMAGAVGPQGEEGPIGPQGIQGVPGEGVPLGGFTAQHLTKLSDADNDTDWTELVSGMVGGKLAVVAVLPGTPDANTIYFVTS